MKATERDDLLTRLDERTDTIIGTLADVRDHLARVNGRLDEHGENIAKLKVTTYGEDGSGGLCSQAKTNAGNITKLMILVAVIAAGVGGGVAELIKIL